jgi:hypothetical protein
MTAPRPLLDFLLANLRTLTQEHYPDCSDFRDDELAERLGLARFPTTDQPEWLSHRRIFLAAQTPSDLLRARRQLEPELAVLDSLALWCSRDPPA